MRTDAAMRSPARCSCAHAAAHAAEEDRRPEGDRRLGVRPRLVVAAVCFLVACGCEYSNVRGAPRPADVVIPDALTFTSHSLEIRLEPTVMLWAREERIDVRALVDGAVATIQRKLETAPVPVTIQAGSYRTIPDVGIGGETNPATGEVKVTMDQRSPLATRTLLEVWLPLALAHELHHAKRVLDGPGYGTTLLEAMVTEGTAEAFVRETFPDAPPIPWVRSLSPSESRSVWERVQREGGDPDDGAQHDSWFYGSRGLPRWAGYRIGYAIARAYLEHHPDASAAGLALVSAERIVSESKFRPS